MTFKLINIVFLEVLNVMKLIVGMHFKYMQTILKRKNDQKIIHFDYSNEKISHDEVLQYYIIAINFIDYVNFMSNAHIWQHRSAAAPGTNIVARSASSMRAHLAGK